MSKDGRTGVSRAALGLLGLLVLAGLFFSAATTRGEVDDSAELGAGIVQPEPEVWSDEATGKLLRFWVNYTEGDLRADFNGDGVLTSADYSAMLAGLGDGGGDDGGGDGDGGDGSGGSGDGGGDDGGDGGVGDDSHPVDAVYVSPGGDDSADGSIGSPVATLDRALQLGDYAALERGGSYELGGGGRLPRGGITLAAYGDGPRPKLPRVRASGDVDDVRLQSLEMVGDHSYTMVRAVGDCDRWVIDDCVIERGRLGVHLQGDKPTDDRGANFCDDWRITNNSFWNNFTFTHSQSVFAAWHTGLVIEGNAFGAELDRTDMEVATIFAHHNYIQYNGGGSRIVNNFYYGPPSHGVQQRPGGELVGNVFVGCPIAWMQGDTDRNSSTEDLHTDSVALLNLVVEPVDISPSKPRGFGGDNSTPLRDAVVERNVMLGVGRGVTLYDNAVGDREISVHANLISVRPNGSPIFAESGSFEGVQISSNSYTGGRLAKGPGNRDVFVSSPAAPNRAVADLQLRSFEAIVGMSARDVVRGWGEPGVPGAADIIELYASELPAGWPGG